MRSLIAVLRAIAKPTSLAFTPARRPQTLQTPGGGRASTHYLRVSRLLAITAVVDLRLLHRRLSLGSFLPCTAGSSAAADVAFVTFSLRVAEKQHEFLPCLADPPPTDHRSALLQHALALALLGSRYDFILPSLELGF